MRRLTPGPAPDDEGRPPGAIARRRPTADARTAAFELRALAFAAVAAAADGAGLAPLLGRLRECTGRRPRARVAAAVRRIAAGGAYVPPGEVALLLRAAADALERPAE